MPVWTSLPAAAAHAVTAAATAKAAPFALAAMIALAGPIAHAGPAGAETGAAPGIYGPSCRMASCWAVVIDGAGQATVVRARSARRTEALAAEVMAGAALADSRLARADFRAGPAAAGACIPRQPAVETGL